MRKLLIIAAIIVAVFMAGCEDSSTAGIASGNGVGKLTGDKNLGELEVKQDGTAESKDPIGDAVSEGVKKIEDATDSAIARIESATGTQSKSAESQATTSTTPINRKISVNKSFDTPVGLLHIESIDLMDIDKVISFNYRLPLKEEFIKNNVKFGSFDLESVLVDSSGKRFLCGGHSALQAWFPYGDLAMLLPIKIETTFKGLLKDPVTITLDIPME